MSLFLSFLDGLSRVAAEVRALLPTTRFIHAFLEEDRRFLAEEYPAHPSGGVWEGRTTPWLADILSVPPEWSWTPADLLSLTRRQVDIKAANRWIQEHVPGQRYEGPTAAQVLHQRFQQGMWSPRVFSATQVETLVAHWVHDDAEFARQRLGGANPAVIARYQGGADDLRDLLDGSAGAQDRAALLTQLSEAQARGGLFVCDYRPMLGGVAREGYVRAGRHFAVPLVFLAVEADPGPARLMPVAIQIDAPGRGYVYSPADDENSWLLAKLWAASADTQAWFSGAHLFRTHSVGAVFAIAALQALQTGRLSRSHPIVTLMYPHLEKVFDINHFVYDAHAYARGGHLFGIYQKGSAASPGFTDQALPTGRIGIYQIIHDSYDGFVFEAHAFDVEHQARGVDAASLPVSFPFRDDGAVWWEAILRFVGEVVEASYADDAAVAADAELGAWLSIVEEAFNQGGAQRFAWRPGRAALVRVLANAIFVCSVQHAAVNDAQFDQSAFVPNGAFAMTAPPPKGPGVTDAQLLASLPDPQVLTDGAVATAIVAQIGFAMSGTTRVGDALAGEGELADLHARYRYAQGTAQHAAVGRFYDAIWKGPDAVRARIAANRAARVAACPARPVPNSVVYPYLDAALAPGSHINAAVTRCILV